MVLEIIGATVLGLAFTGLGLYSYYNKKELMQKAEPVEARVLDTRVEKERETGEHNHGYNYYPRVRYEYYVDGTKYQSTSVYPGGEEAKNTEDAAREVVAPYQEGQRIEAYVNPDDLDESYLIETAAWKSLLLVPFGIGALGLAVWMLIGG